MRAAGSGDGYIKRHEDADESRQRAPRRFDRHLSLRHEVADGAIVRRSVSWGLGFGRIIVLAGACKASGERFVTPPGQRVETWAASHQCRVEGRQQGDQDSSRRSKLHAWSVDSLS
jgi:hypothetical protein